MITPIGAFIHFDLHLKPEQPYMPCVFPMILFQVIQHKLIEQKSVYSQLVADQR